MPAFNYAKVSGESSGDSPLLDSDTHPGPSRPTARSKITKIVRILRWPTVFLLLFAILSCVLSILNRQPASSQLGGELNSLLPNFSKQQKIFREDHRFSSDHKTSQSINATKQHWLDLMPRGDGFIDVPEYKSYTLPPPMHYPETPGQEVYAIALFHQLHCLMSISGFMDKLVMQIRQRDFTLSEGEVDHNDHCFNYLRNAIMCCGDTTLEGQSQAPMFKDTPATDGNGAVHICRNYDEIAAWAVQHKLEFGSKGHGLGKHHHE
ncbi:hypothetical protein T440DRAFT_447799 [Plenodomus tracheiphilus IPT5]|uniref:Oxidase ustYa n=1 Tax=Plenodomus tracheiphilus IPT5 TaxID=1408161 RepID=A0A6A7B800_9PLEO|nr:hypothetical protein T440DRAFT_447799 [Plenodomus tracheiphilus IPT5]